MLTLAPRGKVLVATLHRNVQNTIDDALVDALEHALAQAQRLEVAVLHLRTSSPHFCGGADPARVAQWLEAAGSEALRKDGDRWDELFRRIEHSTAVVFAEVKGNALGAGLSLALACDLRMLAATSRVGVPEVRWGLLPAGRTMERLVRVTGMVTAQRLLLGGDIVDGREAYRLGLAHWIAPDNEIELRAAQAVERIANQSLAALREGKRVLASSLGGDTDRTVEVEAGAFDRLIRNEECRVSIKALLGRLARGD